MKHISILVPKGALLASLEGTRMLFTQVNGLARQRGSDPVFDVHLVGLSGQTPVSGGLFTVNPGSIVDDVTKTDLVVIPAFDGDPAAAVEANVKFIPWIKAQYAGGAEVASLCIGAFLLAATGLVDGRKCATHWMAANDFRRLFPNVNLVTEQIITDEARIYTSGGAFSYLNLILYLVEKYAGREMAVTVAKLFAIEMERRSQSPFTIFHGQKQHDDDLVKEVQAFIEANYRERMTVDDLADRFAISRRALERRFKKVTYNSILEYLQRVRIEAAKQSLESERENVNEAMYKVGYTDTKAFRTTFKKLTGLSPVAYRNKYSRLAVAS